MYKILGGDGREYGPVPAETLREWITQGRANAETQVQPEGTGGWLPLGNLTEFADLTGAPPPGAIPAYAPGAAGAAPDRDAALALANPAGWALLIVGALGILTAIGQIVYYAIQGIPSNPLLERFMPQHGVSDANKAGQAVGFYAALVFGIAWSGFVAYAGMKLRRMESWGLVMAGAILAIIPCCGSQFPVCALSTPAGIWAVIVICQSKVKNAFA